MRYLVLMMSLALVITVPFAIAMNDGFPTLLGYSMLRILPTNRKHLKAIPKADAPSVCCRGQGNRGSCDGQKYMCADGTESTRCKCPKVPSKADDGYCTAEWLYDEYKRRKRAGEVMENLSTKDWWKKCPAYVRSAVWDIVGW
jgi:hypothetical protein